MCIRKFSTLIFDCDGVILDSNSLKTQAFYQAALPYGEAAAKALVDYHVQNGGISRYHKFQYFLQTIVGIDAPNHLNILLSTYAAYVREGLLSCSIVLGLAELRQLLPDTRWLVVSGGNQAELRDVFKQRGISHLFDGGIYGSPDTKDEILVRELNNGNIKLPSVFFGDSRYDHEVACRTGIDFVFVSNWSEFASWEVYFREHPAYHISGSIETFYNWLVEHQHDGIIESA